MSLNDAGGEKALAAALLTPKAKLPEPEGKSFCGLFLGMNAPAPSAEKPEIQKQIRQNPKTISLPSAARPVKFSGESFF
jgi:hypothetical protein